MEEGKQVKYHILCNIISFIMLCNILFFIECTKNTQAFAQDQTSDRTKIILPISSDDIVFKFFMRITFLKGRKLRIQQP